MKFLLFISIFSSISKTLGKRLASFSQCVLRHPYLRDEKFFNMAKRLTLEDKVESIREIGENEITYESISALNKALKNKSNILVRKAAKVIEKCEIRESIPELQKAFYRFMGNPVKTDPNCLAKMALIDALYALDCKCFDIYLKGSKHIQMEPVYGGRKDTADELRGRCIQALVSFGYSEAMLEITRLLYDDCVSPRRSAADSLSQIMSSESELLLRMKVYSGDNEPDVIGICFSGLIAIAPERNISFVASYLDNSDDDIVLLAALALGESRSDKAFEILEKKFNSYLLLKEKKRFIVPISLLRTEKAFEFLIRVIKEETGELNEEAYNAIQIYADSPERKEIIDGL